MRKSKFHVNAALQCGVALFRLTSVIAGDGDSSAATIRAQVDNFLISGIAKAEVYISCEGGDVFEAVEIVNQLKRFGSQNVKVKVGALAASAATYITSNFYTVANTNSQLMIHKPSLGTYGNVKDIEADVKLLKNATADYKNVYSNKTGKTPDQIEELWGNGDFWMTAQEALQHQFIDEVAIEPAQTVTAIATGKSLPNLNPRADWKYSDWQEKDPKGLEALATEHKDLFTFMFNREFKNSAPGKLTSHIQPNMTGRESWSYSDWQEKDSKGLEALFTHNKPLFDSLFKRQFSN